MELLKIGHILARRRIVVAVGLLLAVALGAHISGAFPPQGSGGPVPATGAALARVLIDTPAPLAATTIHAGADTITERATLLAAQMGSSQITAMIAQRAGVDPKQVAVVGPEFAPVSFTILLPDGQFPQVTANTAATAIHQPYVVSLVPEGSVPIISIGTAAPDARSAARLAQATVAVMRSANDPATKGRSALSVESLGSVRSVAVPRLAGHHLLLGMVAAVMVFIAWCAGIVIASGLARAWRGTSGRASQVLS